MSKSKSLPLTKAAVELKRLLRPAPPMTQQGLADALGITQQAVSSWLCGVTRPNYETRMKIHSILGVAIEDWAIDSTSDESGPAVDTDVSAADDDEPAVAVRPTGT